MQAFYTSIICALTLTLVQDGFAQRDIQIIVGQSKTITIPAGSQVIIGDGAVATAQRLANQRQISITGRAKGVTSLIISSPGGGQQERLIRVLERDPRGVLSEIKAIYGEIEGVSFGLRGGEVIAEGTVYTETDAATLAAILDRYGQVINMVENRSEKPMFNIKVQFIEVNRSKGVDFNNQPLPIGSASYSKQSGSPATWSFGAQASDLFERIAYWKSQGIAKTIAEPTLTVMNQDTATFLSGGEVPIVIQTRDGLSVTYKEFGIRLKIVPELQESGKILAEVTAEVSGVDFSTQNETTGAPGFRSRRVSSRGLIKEGETIALAGLYQKTIQKNRSRVPVLGHLLPFIFSSVKESEEVKELIVLVTPQTAVDFNLDDYPMIKKEMQSSKRD